MKAFLLFFLIMTSSPVFATCDIDSGSQILNDLDRFNNSGESSLLDSILETADNRTTANTSSTPKLSYEERINSNQVKIEELKADNNSDPAEIYKLQKENAKLESKQAQVARESQIESEQASLAKLKEENPSFLDDILDETEQRQINSEQIVKRTDVSSGESIEIPRSVMNQLRKEGMSETDIILKELKPGDQYQAWFAGGEYKPITVLGPADAEGFIRIRYKDGDKIIEETKPIDYLTLTQKRKKEAEEYYNKHHKVSIDEIIDETQNRTLSAKELVDLAVKESMKDPRAEVIENELNQIIRRDGVHGMASDRYIQLQDKLKEITYPSDPLNPDEIENVFAPLEIVLAKEKHGSGDKALIAEAERILASKKVHHARDKEYRELLEKAKSAPEKNRQARVQKVVTQLREGASSFRYFRPKYNSGQLRSAVQKTSLSRDDIEIVAKALSRDPSEEKIGYSERKVLERFMKQTKDLNDDTTTYFRNRYQLYQDYSSP